MFGRPAMPDLQWRREFHFFDKGGKM